MRHVLTTVSFIILAMPVWADEKTDKSTKETKIHGRIVSIDDSRLTVFTRKGELKLQVTKDTRIRLEGKDVPLKQLQIGDPVTIRYEPGSREHRAIELNSDVATARELGKELKEAIKAASALAYREKEQFKTQMANVLRDLDAQIDKLMAQGKELSADVRERYAREIKKLKDRRNAVARELQQAGNATADTWEDLKKGVSTVMGELGDAVSKAFGDDSSKDKPKPKDKSK